MALPSESVLVTREATLQVLLIDPSLFTAPYDAALTRGLAEAGAAATWATRGLRAGETAHLPSRAVLPIFYPWTDGPRRSAAGWKRYLKGIEHLFGLVRLAGSNALSEADVIHLQWSVLPPIDRLALRRFRRHRPVILTVHDTTPFNGRDVPRVQRAGLAKIVAEVDHLIVHTPGARDHLIATGIAPDRISIVAHGLLTAPSAAAEQRDGRWRIVQFGRIQHYKGVDLLIEALGHIAPDDRGRIEVIIAGEPMIDLAPLIDRVAALGLGDVVRFQLGHLSEEEMADLLASADTFVFPYRAIEASGVLFLIASLGRWIVASDRGAFPAMLGADGEAGALVDPEDPAALARALVAAIGRTPSRSIAAEVPAWSEIGRATRAVYERTRERWRNERGG